MTRYAAETEVSADRSRAEVERTLARYGATQFIYGWDREGGTAILGFRLQGRMIRLVVPMPSPDDPEFRLSPGGRTRPNAAITAAYEQAVRQRWRAVALIVKAKLEAVEAGISSVEQEFLANILLPDGRTVGQWAQPQIEAVYTTGQMPRLLPGLPGDLGLLLESGDE